MERKLKFWPDNDDEKEAKGLAKKKERERERERERFISLKIIINSVTVAQIY